MKQTSTYYASLPHLYHISLHIILPDFIILPSRFYPHFLIKYWYAGLQLYSPILYPPLLRDILIRNMLTTAHQDLLYNFKCHPHPSHPPLSYSKIYQLFPYVALVMTN
jgi:hypothetical protein